MFFNCLGPFRVSPLRSDLCHPVLRRWIDCTGLCFPLSLTLPTESYGSFKVCSSKKRLSEEGRAFLGPVKHVLQPMRFVWDFLWSHLAESEMKRDPSVTEQCWPYSHPAVLWKGSGDLLVTRPSEKESEESFSDMLLTWSCFPWGK